MVKIDSASDPDQEYTYLMGSETIDSASDPDQEYIYSTRLVILIKNIYPSACNILMGSETLPSAGYILLDESSIPFYSTSNDMVKIDSASDPDQEYTYLMGSETIDSASDPDQEYIYIYQEYIYFLGSETLPSGC